FERQDRNRPAAHAHSDQRNKVPKDRNIDRKSMSPRRKLIATNGARAAKRVPSFTAWAISLPITIRRGDRVVTVTRSSVRSIRSLRNALNAPSGATIKPITERQVISDAKICVPDSRVPVVAYVLATNATINPAT